METKHTIGIGIIGMGWMGMTHARAYRQIADIQTSWEEDHWVSV